ncbi:MAG: amino acid adenylation domain-containing protein [Gammaproteobacteria bacterium]|nr:amino acid adenylation domain-containing protein [Gammaproteobacteria bacterium]
MPTNTIPPSLDALTPQQRRELLARLLRNNANQDRVWPVSSAQEGMWFQRYADPASSAFHVALALHLHSEFDVAALRRACQQFIDRHPLLRAVFRMEAGRLVQRIAAQQTIDFTVVNVSGMDDAALRQRVDHAYRQPFDLERGPLARIALFRRAGDDHVLLLTVHHIVYDGWSMWITLDELGRLYTAEATAVPATLPSLPGSYEAYVQRQEAMLASERGEQLWSFWRDELTDVPALLDLPHDRPPSSEKSRRGASYKFTLTPQLTTRIKQQARSCQTSLFVWLLAVYQILLYRYTGQEKFSVSSVTAGRGTAEDLDIVGYFVNPIVLKADLAANPRFVDFIERVRQTVLRALDHPDYPFALLVNRLHPRRDPSYLPFGQAFFLLQQAQRTGASASLTSERFHWGSLELEHYDLAQQENQSELDLEMIEFQGGLLGTLKYNADRFDRSTITRMVGHFVNLCEAILQNPQACVADLPLLSATERAQLLVEWNRSDHDFPLDQTYATLFARRVAQHPDRAAAVCNGESFTYRELDQRAHRIAQGLRDAGVDSNHLVALLGKRDFALMGMMIGVFKAGAAFLPLDVNHPPQRLREILQSSGTTTLLVSESASGWLKEVLRDLKTPPTILIAETLLMQAAIVDLPVSATPQDLAYVIFTSGSTGKPKGAMIEQRGMVNHMLGKILTLEITEADRLAQTAFPSFDIFIWQMLTAPLAGGVTHILSDTAVLDPLRLIEVIEQEKITLLETVPSQLRHLLDLCPQNASLSSLRWMIPTGEALPLTLTQDWFERFPGIPLMNVYGPAECSDDVAFHPITTRPDDNSTIPIGRPTPNNQLFILDKYLQPVPIGVAGEIYVGGVGVGCGYLNDPEKTRESFVPNPFAPGKRCYRTGDLGRYRANGVIDFLGRRDHQVKIRGARIELGEIEAALGALPDVHEAVVVAREDRPGDKQLVAYVVTKLDPHELRNALASRLPEYMLPTAYVALDALPVTPNGKLDRQALAAPDASARVTRPYELPQGHLERAVAAVWQELLNIETIGRHDNFFELGGHSLLAVQLIARLRQLPASEQQGLTIDAGAVFSAPTVAGLAAVIAGDATKPTFQVPPNRIPVDCTALTPDLLPLVSLTQAEIDRIVSDVPEGVADIQDIYPLSPLQAGFLFHYLMETERDIYMLRSVLTFDNRNRLESFLAAWQTVLDRHDILRSSIHWRGLSRPVQVVHRQAQLSVKELTATASDDALTLLQHHTDHHKRLDLQRAPLLQAYTVTDPKNGQCYVALLYSHLVCDQVTLGVVIDETQMLLAGKSDRLPTPLPYRNFVAQTLALPTTEQEAYFRQQLGDIDAPTAPFGLLNVPGDSAHIKETTVALPETLSQRLRDSARRHRVTPAVLFHLAWAQVVAACSGQDDVVFGTVLLGRSHGMEGNDRILGVVLNTLPIRFSLAAKYSVSEAVQQMRQRLGELLAHEHAPLALAQRCSRVAPPLPLFTTLLNYRHSDPSAAAMSAWEGVRLLASEERTHYPFTIAVDDFAAGFSLTVQCQAIAPARIAGYLHTAIEGLVDALEHAPQQLLDTLSILPLSEREQLLIRFNETAVNYPQGQLIHQLFEAQVERTPLATAVVFEGERLSYGELNRCANQVAHALLSFGIRSDDRVALYVERGFDMMIGLLGILKAGAAYVPLDPSYPEARLAFMLADSAPTIVLTQSALCNRLPKVTVPVVALDAADRFLQQPDTNPDVKSGLTASPLAYVIYTSGSTGQPKGVMVDHASVVNVLRHFSETLDITQQDVLLAVTTLSFDIAGLEWYLPLINGGQVVLVDRRHTADAEFLIQAIEQFAITIMQATPATWRLLLAERSPFLSSSLRSPLSLVSSPGCSSASCARDIRASMRSTRGEGDPAVVAEVMTNGWQALQLTALCGGEALPTELARRLRPRVKALWNLYGPTETTIWSTGLQILASGVATPIEPIGRPIANTRIYILDAHKPVPMGATGEIYIGGTGVSRGYLNRPDLTTERFLPDPFTATPDARMYRTGDRARYLPDGTIEFLGRTDSLVKIRGFRIELGEIEAQLKKFPGVREAVVTVRNDLGDLRLVAYLLRAYYPSPFGRGDGVREMPLSSTTNFPHPDPLPEGEGEQPSTDDAISIADLRTHLAAALPEYMLPAAYVVLDALPLTPNGKLDRTALPAPNDATYLQQRYEAPIGAVEIAIANLWQTLLGVDRVGRQDHFFELGGHSLLAVQCINRLRETLAVDIELRELFAEPRLQGFAQRVAAATRVVLPPILSIDRAQPLPLSFAQQRLWFLDQLDPAASAAYQQPVALRLQGKLNVPALQAAFNRLVARHETLRTTFIKAGGEPRQVIAPAECGFTLTQQDLRDATPQEQQAAVNHLVSNDLRQPFDIANGPLIHGCLLVLGDDEHILYLNHHHIISDGWSIGILVKEVSVLYAAFVHGEPDPLPSLPIQYVDYAVWQRQALSTDIVRTPLDFWRRQLADAPALLQLPFDYPRPARQSYAGAAVRFTLSVELTRALKTLGQRHGTTLFMTLLAGWSILLARLSGQSDLVIGTVVANRQRPEVESLIGFFVNMLALRITLDDEATVAQVLSQAKALTLSAFAHQHVPFEHVVETLQPERSLSHSPLFQVALVLNNTPMDRKATLPDLQLAPMELARTTTSFDLLLSLNETGDHIAGELQYAGALFEQETIERFVGHLQTLLMAMITDDTQPIYELPLLSAVERQQQLVEWNGHETT